MGVCSYNSRARENQSDVSVIATVMIIIMRLTHLKLLENKVLKLCSVQY